MFLADKSFEILIRLTNKVKFYCVVKFSGDKNVLK